MGCNVNSLVCDARHRPATAGRRPRFAVLWEPGVEGRRCDEHGYGRDYAVLEGGRPGIAARAALGGRLRGIYRAGALLLRGSPFRRGMVCWLAFAAQVWPGTRCRG
jgi:hypothetical protein